MSVAGSDSGGGAGIQADLRAIVANGGFGTTVITALTAQNLEGVSDVHGVPTEHVRSQLDAVIGGFSVRAAKTGMLWSTETISVVSECLDKQSFPWVVDPVMVATSGARLLRDDAIDAYRRVILPRATLITPNLDEAAVLLDVQSVEDADQVDAAKALSDTTGTSVLVKGGHRQGAIVDVLVHDSETFQFPAPRRVLNTHGSGCALAAALATHLAHGRELVEAVETSLRYLQSATAEPAQLERGVRLLGLEHFGPSAGVVLGETSGLGEDVPKPPSE